MRAIMILAAVTLALPAAAQMGGMGGPGSGAGAGAGMIGGAERPRAERRERPPGLPGLQGRASVVVPPTRPPGLMNPNDALFDAISRGDVQAARDAVSRGADTNARGPLGLTPVESAVDHGRPDVMFYLLSLRGSAGNPAAPPPPAPVRATRPEPAARATAAPVVAPAAPPARPRLWANDGGAARPEVGFLGFDSGRASGASPDGQRTRRPDRSG
jgi:hypothetical protein